ncbi:MAG: CARDB domain-containing protein [Chloroflexota bacterium]|nr:CARDB domain-containing protein [Chloroflexota bacterium]
MRFARLGMVLLAAAGALMVALAAATYAWEGPSGAGAAPLGSLAPASVNSAGVVSGTIRVTNVRDQGFTVSWLTTDVVTGAVRYGQSLGSLTSVAQDEITITSRTHHVTLGDTELSPDTRYYYDLLTSEGVDDNGGVHYLYATGPTLSVPPLGVSVYGQVVTTTGAELPGSIVYWWLQDSDNAGSPGASQPQSMLAKAAEGWNFNTGSVRQGDLTDYFDYTAGVDLIKLAVQGAPDGRANDSFPINLGANRTVTVAAGTLAPPPAPVPTPGPDLVVDDVTVSPGSPGPGCSLTLAVSIRNQGSVSVTTPFRVALYLDHSRVPYPGERSNTNTYWVVSQTLAPSGTLSLSAMNPAVASGAITTLTASGSHTLYAQVDSYNNQVGETDEANNVWGQLLVDTSGTCYHIYLPLITKAM